MCSESTPTSDQDTSEDGISDETIEQSDNWDEFAHLSENTNAHPHDVIRDFYMYVAEVAFNNTSLIVKKPGRLFNQVNPAEDEHTLTSRIRAMQRMKCTAGVEQLVAFSLPDLVVISETVPGNTLDRLDVLDADAMTAVQFQNLLESLESIGKAGVDVDPHIGNFIFDRNNGFTVIDYALRDVDDTVVIPAAEDYGGILADLHEIYFIRAKNLDVGARWYAALIRGREVLLNNYADIFDSTPINAHVKRIHETIRDL